MSRYLKVKLLFLVAAAILLVLKLTNGISPWWILGLIAIYAAVVSFGVFNLWWGFFIPVKFRGPSDTPEIALTFDDGPIEGKTEKVLGILRESGVQATFFCIGTRVAAHPEIVEKIHEQGHLIGNHTFSHSATIDLYPTKRIARELHDTDEVIAEVLGHRPRFFRPPYGITNPMIARAAKLGKYQVIGWSVRSFDTIIHHPEKLMRRTARSLKAGDIVLFHDFSDSMLAILPDFIKRVQASGYRIVRLDQLLNENPYR
jgi:peptidoglycan-N-acetylglucosamine deacetylase